MGGTSRARLGAKIMIQVAERQWRPGFVVAEHGREASGYSLVNAVVLMDGINDRSVPDHDGGLTMWWTSVMHGDDVGHWLWPEELPDEAR